MAAKSGKGKKKSSSKAKATEAARLPFEPVPNPKKSSKPATASLAVNSEANSEGRSRSVSSTPKAPIPKIVSQRMVRRMAVFCGIPTALGMLTFVASYFIVTQAWFELPHVAVVLTSASCFGLGILGLSYGAFSSSWDENRVGGLLGWNEFTTNFGRTRNSWREARQQNQAD